MYKSKKCPICGKDYKPEYSGQKYDNYKCVEQGRKQSLVKYLAKLVKEENDRV